MSKLKSIARDDDNRVRALLKKAPEKPKAPTQLTTREIVAAIGADIRDVQKRNYTLDDISAIIREGINMEILGASTLRSNFQKKRRTKIAARTPRNGEQKKG